MSNQDYALIDDTGDDGVVRKYPMDKPYMQRDTGARGGDDTIYVVLSDVVDVLNSELQMLEIQAQSLNASLCAAEKLLEEAENLPWNDHHSWTDVYEDPDAPEKLQDMLREAEQLDHIYIDWNGDGGTVTVTLSEYWEEHDGS